MRHHSGAGREKGETPVSRLDCPACPSVQVKRAVVQVISAMAHHGYLEQPGGEAMLEYIVQQCALPPDTQVRALPLLGRGPVGSTGEWAPEGAWPQVGAGGAGPAAFSGVGWGLCTPVVTSSDRKQNRPGLALRLFCLKC